MLKATLIINDVLYFFVGLYVKGFVLGPFQALS